MQEAKKRQPSKSQEAGGDMLENDMDHEISAVTSVAELLGSSDDENSKVAEKFEMTTK